MTPLMTTRTLQSSAKPISRSPFTSPLPSPIPIRKYEPATRDPVPASSLSTLVSSKKGSGPRSVPYEQVLDPADIRGHVLDQWVEGMRVWVSAKILQPFLSDLDDLTQLLNSSQMPHLLPSVPLILSTAISNTPHPVSVLDMFQRFQNEPVTKRRMFIEKYLEFEGFNGGVGVGIGSVSEEGVKKVREYVLTRVRGMFL